MKLFAILLLLVFVERCHCQHPVKMSRAHKYKVLEYFTEQLYKSDDKVKNITQLNKNDFYTHLFDAYDRKMNDLSLVSLHKQENGSLDIQGANMVLRQSEINNMYAYEQLGKVVDFVTTCYQLMKPQHIDMKYGFVSILRASNTPVDNKLLIHQTAEKIKAQSSLAGQWLYHFVWEKITASVSPILILC
ncbi:hypothetical protein Ciccas_013335 [Cichlidogyrus casuarinus]|uniref:Uncharacterized protein n=1 Tax=Cichlidogyrus casuarinus TaxID=1844966 RepID=A0ABD2PKV1_9PLAT